MQGLLHGVLGGEEHQRRASIGHRVGDRGLVRAVLGPGRVGQEVDHDVASVHDLILGPRGLGQDVDRTPVGGEHARVAIEVPTQSRVDALRQGNDAAFAGGDVRWPPGHTDRPPAGSRRSKFQGSVTRPKRSISETDIQWMSSAGAASSVNQVELRVRADVRVVLDEHLVLGVLTGQVGPLFSARAGGPGVHADTRVWARSPGRTREEEVDPAGGDHAVVGRDQREATLVHEARRAQVGLVVHRPGHVRSSRSCRPRGDRGSARAPGRESTVRSCPA